MKVIEFVKAGKSVFFTGCAGTGKSVRILGLDNSGKAYKTKNLTFSSCFCLNCQTLLRYLIGMLPKGETYVTAATGVAAVNIGGTTLHSFAVRFFFCFEKMFWTKLMSSL
jgi:ATP-dependent DNA helicase PIF1